MAADWCCLLPRELKFYVHKRDFLASHETDALN
jgi:hypothetical protein